MNTKILHTNLILSQISFATKFNQFPFKIFEYSLLKFSKNKIILTKSKEILNFYQTFNSNNETI